MECRRVTWTLRPGLVWKTWEDYPPKGIIYLSSKLTTKKNLWWQLTLVKQSRQPQRRISGGVYTESTPSKTTKTLVVNAGENIDIPY